VNPDRIYSQYREDALAKQITSKDYNIFVAMPFQERYSYPSRNIFDNIIKTSVSKANSLLGGGRKFADPIRADDEPGTAGVITEDIIVRILECHVFLADLTFQNPGVLLEVGISFGLKPNKQIILITQDDLNTLHFDIRNNRIIRYDNENSTEQIGEALKSGVEFFEKGIKSYIESVKKTLSPDAILCLNFYGRLRRDNPNQAFSLHLGLADKCFQEPNPLGRFNDATRELLLRKLIWTDYSVGAVPGGDAFGMHATELGWVLIENMWNDLNRP